MGVIFGVAGHSGRPPAHDVTDVSEPSKVSRASSAALGAGIQFRFKTKSFSWQAATILSAQTSRLSGASCKVSYNLDESLFCRFQFLNGTILPCIRLNLR
jgi:hypothetical protein